MMLILDWQRKLVVPRIMAERDQAKDVSAEHKHAGGEHFWTNEESALAIEFGVIAALIAPACIIAFTSLGLNLDGIFEVCSNSG